MGKVRSFIAANLNDDVVREIERVRGELKGTRARVKWVSEKNLHFTLKFLGDVEQERLTGPVVDALTGALRSLNPFSTEVYGLGAFPHPERPRVLWVGTAGGAERMKELHRKIEGALTGLGFETERRPFIPHITIGRVRDGRNVDRLRRLFRRFEGEAFGTVEIPAVQVMKSRLTSRGPIYTALSRIPLGA